MSTNTGVQYVSIFGEKIPIFYEEPTTKQLGEMFKNDICSELPQFQLISSHVIDGNLEAVKEAFSTYNVNVNQVNSEGLTFAHYACRLGHLEILKSLVEMGASLDACTRFGSTLLGSALYNKHYDIVDYLLEKGVKIDRESLSIDKDGYLKDKTSSI